MDYKNDSISDKIYFSPGDLVTLNKDIPNKPIMMVIRKETSMFKHQSDSKDILKGIRCMWFTKNGELQEHIYNTKDLIKL